MTSTNSSNNASQSQWMTSVALNTAFHSDYIDAIPHSPQKCTASHNWAHNEHTGALYLQFNSITQATL